MISLLGAGQGQNGSYIDVLLSQFKERVAVDSGTFEAENCLKSTLTVLNNIN